MKIAVLFDGAGLARLGLEQAGHECMGFELDVVKHWLGLHVGSGNSTHANALEVDLSPFDAVWASPPCQSRSKARTEGVPVSIFSGDYVEWALAIDKPILWVENVTTWDEADTFGKVYNAAQFLFEPLQNRNRIIGGRFPEPKVIWPYQKVFKGTCPTITASEYKGSWNDKRRASRFYKGRVPLVECARLQGFSIPRGWCRIPTDWPFTPREWEIQLYEAIGNGVPVYMAKAFGEALNDPEKMKKFYEQQNAK